MRKLAQASWVLQLVHSHVSVCLQEGKAWHTRVSSDLNIAMYIAAGSNSTAIKLEQSSDTTICVLNMQVHIQYSENHRCDCELLLPAQLWQPIRPHMCTLTHGSITPLAVTVAHSWGCANKVRVYARPSKQFNVYTYVLAARGGHSVGVNTECIHVTLSCF